MNMKKIFLLCTLFLFMRSFSYSLENSLGLYAGVGGNFLLGADSTPPGSGSRFVNLGYGGGFFWNLELNPYLSLQLDGSLGNAGAAFRSGGKTTDFPYPYTAILFFLKPQIPLQQNFNGVSLFNLYFLAGGGIGILLSSAPLPAGYPSDKPVAARLGFGVGLEGRLSSKGFLFFDGRYSLNLSSHTTAVRNFFFSGFRFNSGIRLIL